MSKSYYQFEVNGESFVIPVKEREHAERILRAAIAGAERAVTITGNGGTFQAVFPSNAGEAPYYSWETNDLEEREYHEITARRPRRPFLSAAKRYILAEAK